MTKFLILMGMLVGAFVGGFIGFWLGDREGGDFNIAPVIYTPVGMVIGGFIGTTVSVLVFA